MRAPSSTSTLVSRMIAMAGQGDEAPGVAEMKEPAHVKRIVWASQAAKLRVSLSARSIHEIEAAVTADLDSMELPEVFFTSVEVGGHVVTCDLDASGTASIFGLIEAHEYEGRVFQHELDHLDGVLLLERMDDDQRKQAKRAVREMLMRRQPAVPASPGLSFD